MQFETMITITTFNTFLAVMAILAVIVFIALHFVTAGYGMMYDRRWGPTVSNRIGWVLMEAPVFIAMALLWWFSDRRFATAPLVMFLLFELHYFQRSFVFPLLIKSKGKMPIAIIAMGVLFNVCNALMQGGWLFYVSDADRYPTSWLWSWQFIAGTLIFFAGMAINIHSDHIIRNLRAPGEKRHYIPRGGMFRYVSSANYFGEFTEWVGFAVLTWSWAGAVFALWTFANLAPRAEKISVRYSSEFGVEFTRLRLHRIIPFIY
jgi:3-oxo-5-alpha-steroid 4-dehydrogenase 1